MGTCRAVNILVAVFVSSLTWNLAWAEEPGKWTEFEAFDMKLMADPMPESAHELFFRKLPDLEIAAGDFPQAFDELRQALEAELERREIPSEKLGLSVFLEKRSDPAYTTPVKIKKDSISVGGAIDEACKQCGLIWSVTESGLTVRPK